MSVQDVLFSCALYRELKDPVYLRDKVSQKHSKEQFEVAQKIEQEYSKFFTGLDMDLALFIFSFFCLFVSRIVLVKVRQPLN